MAKKRVVPRTVNIADAVFLYASVCCNEIAEKPPLLMPPGRRPAAYVGARPEAEGTLGSWTCSKCKKSCKVTRSKNNKEGADAQS